MNVKIFGVPNHPRQIHSNFFYLRLIISYFLFILINYLDMGIMLVFMVLYVYNITLKFYK